MTLKRGLLAVGLVVLSLLLLPPAAVFARQMLQMATAPDQKAAKAIAAAELRDALAARHAFARFPNTISHPFEYPYLDCEGLEEGKVPAEIDRTLMLVFIVDAQRRDDLATLAALTKAFSRAQISLLTACVEASVLASRCQNIAEDATAGARRSEDPRLSDRNRATAYCAAMTAIGRTGELK